MSHCSMSVLHAHDVEQMTGQVPSLAWLARGSCQGIDSLSIAFVESLNESLPVATQGVLVS